MGEIILWAVRWYCKYGVSDRDLEEMMEERGVDLDHTTLYRWVQHYAPEIEKRLRWAWRRLAWMGRWHVDETYIKVHGRGYLYRLSTSRTENRADPFQKLAFERRRPAFEVISCSDLTLLGSNFRKKLRITAPNATAAR